MVDRLLEKTGPAVQLSSGATTKGEKTRERLLDIAYDAINQKGFAATSIEELVEAAGITKSGFFYHFKDKNDLARQVFDRFLSEDRQIYDLLIERAESLSDDPLQSLLIFLNLYGQMLDDMETIHPGCMVATVTYQDRLFDPDIRQRNSAYLLEMRERFASWFRRAAEVRKPRMEIDAEALADHLTANVEGAIVLSRGLSDPSIMGRQMRLFRQHVRLLFDL